MGAESPVTLAACAVRVETMDLIVDWPPFNDFAVRLIRTVRAGIDRMSDRITFDIRTLQRGFSACVKLSEEFPNALRNLRCAQSEICDSGLKSVAEAALL